MKIFILRNVSINRLLNKELEKLREAQVEFAITDNNGGFGTDNLNTLVFMWEDSLDNKVCTKTISKVIKPIFEWYSEDIEDIMNDYKKISENMLLMKESDVLKYDISYVKFI